MDEVNLKVPAEVLDHPIEHVIEEINAYDFLEQDGILQSQMCPGDLKPGYEPQKYFKDTDLNS